MMLLPELASTVTMLLPEPELGDTSTIITIDDYWLTFIISVGLPAVVALVTKRYGNSMVGAITLLFLASVTGALTGIAANGGSFEVKPVAIGIFVSFVTAVASYFGLLNPLKVTGNEGAIKRSVPGGIG